MSRGGAYSAHQTICSKGGERKEGQGKREEHGMEKGKKGGKGGGNRGLESSFDLIQPEMVPFDPPSPKTPP